MKIIENKKALREYIEGYKKTEEIIGFVPTMGALHAGHISLVKAAYAQCDRVIASLFVNPTQFGVNEDLGNYPRMFKRDVELLRAEGVDMLWAPDREEVYPPGFSTSVLVGGGLNQLLCGASRPGHFDGVTLVVSKLFNQIQPDMAFFGEKDFQQLAIIRRMVRDLDFPVKIMGCPTIRDKDGLAMSSRNAYLTRDERKVAPTIFAILSGVAEKLREGGDFLELRSQAIVLLVQKGFQEPDYFELIDAQSFHPIPIFKDRKGGVSDIYQNARLLIAVKLGETRLIDNIAV